MFLFVIALILGVAALVTLAISLKLDPEKDRYDFAAPRTYARLGAGIGLVIGGILFAISVLTTVPAQNVGVVTEFGRPTGANLGPGLHGKAPWQTVTDMDGTIQQKDNVGEARTAVRLNNNSIMFVENALRWRIKQEAAGTLFADYKGFEKIGPNLVEKELAGALNVVVADYDALTVGAKNKSNDQLAVDIKDRLQQRLGEKIEVVGFTIIRIDFDEATQARINDVQAEAARTRVALQQKETATAQAAANKELAASVSKDPNVIVAQCEATRRLLVEKNQPVPPAWSCWPGGGSAQPVVPVPVPQPK